MKKNINLKNKNLSKKKSVDFGASTNLSIIILVVSFLVYGVIFVMNSLVEKNISKVNTEKKAIETSLKGEEFNEVYNFGVKLIDLESQIGDREFLPQTKNLIEISDKTFDEVVYLGIMAKDEGTFTSYTASLTAPDYNTLARQVKVYKEAKNIHNFFLKSTEEEEGKITALINFDLGKASDLSDLDNSESDSKVNF